MTTKKSPAASVREEVLREFPPLGKYRVRLLSDPKGKKRTLDIREFVTSDTFEGFTRRGVRLSEAAQLDVLRDILKEVLDCGMMQGGGA